MGRITGMDLVTAVNGTLFIDDTSAHAGNFAGIYTASETVVSACLDEDGNSIMVTLGLDGATIPAGVLITLPSDTKNISSITLTSGKVNMIKG
jgi:hypothetical protein